MANPNISLSFNSLTPSLKFSSITSSTVAITSPQASFYEFAPIIFTPTTFDTSWTYIIYRNGTQIATGTVSYSTYSSTGGSSGPSVDFVINDSGLLPNTSYSYTISISGTQASNSPFLSRALSVTTGSSVSLGSLSVLSVGPSTASISHPAAQNGTPGYTFQWYRAAGSGTFTPGPGNILSGQTGVTLNDTGLSASTTYSYICVVTDAASYTANSPQLTLTTNAALAIASPIVNTVGSTNTFLTATGATGGVPGYTYQWYRGSSSGFTPGPGNILNGQTSLILADTGLTATTTYYYKIVVTDSSSNTAASGATNVTTASALTITSPSQVSIGATTAVLTSSGASGGLAPYSYQWFRSTTIGFSPGLSNILVGQVALTLHDAGLTGLTNYYYILQVVDSALDVTNSSRLTVTTLSPPLALGNLIANGVGQSSITLTSPNATGGVPAYSYAWYRSNVQGSLGDLLSFTSQTITDVSLTPATKYFYTCVVTDSASPTPAIADSQQLGITTTAVSTLGEYYADLLAIEYIGQPKFYEVVQEFCNMATMPATSTQTADDILPLVIQNAFNLSTAAGVQLDVIGKYLNVSRFTTNLTGASITLSDIDFQTLIRLAAAARARGNSLAAIDSFLNTYFPGEVFVTDNENMSISYIINSSIGSQNLVDAFINESLLPKPLAVEISSIIVNPSLNFFGFSSYSPLGTWTPPAPLVQGFQTYDSYNMNSPWLDYTMAIDTGI